MLTEKIRVVLTCWLSMALIAGCNYEAAKNEQKVVATLLDLFAFDNIIHNFHDAEGRFPRSWEEAAAYVKKVNEDAQPKGDLGYDQAVLDRLRSLGYTVAWGKKRDDIDTFGAVASCPGNFTMTPSGIDSPNSWPSGWFPTDATKVRLRGVLSQSTYERLNFGN